MEHNLDGRATWDFPADFDEIYPGIWKPKPMDEGHPAVMIREVMQLMKSSARAYALLHDKENSLFWEIQARSVIGAVSEIWTGRKDTFVNQLPQKE